MDCMHTLIFSSEMRGGRKGERGGGKEGGMERVERERRTEAGLTITRTML